MGYGNEEADAEPLFVLLRGPVILIGLLCFICFLAEAAILDWSALFLALRGLDPAHGGLGYAAFAVAMSLGRLTGDRIVTALGGRKVLLYGSLCAAAGFLLPAIVPSGSVALFGFVLIGLGASNIVPVLFTAAGQQTAMPAHLAIGAITPRLYGYPYRTSPDWIHCGRDESANRIRRARSHDGRDHPLLRVSPLHRRKSFEQPMSGCRATVKVRTHPDCRAI